jgi:hypothetical protein
MQQVPVAEETSLLAAVAVTMEMKESKTKLRRIRRLERRVV